MLNKEELKAIATKNDTSKNIFYVLGSRQRTRHTTDLVRFKLFLTKQFGQINQAEFEETFQSLENAGIGRTIKGKFIWNYDLIQVGRYAMNGEKSPESIGERRIRRVPRPKLEVAPEQKPVEEAPTFPGMRVDIKKGDMTISATLNADQLLEVLKKIG
jgi:hypothetical protein